MTSRDNIATSRMISVRWKLMFDLVYPFL